MTRNQNWVSWEVELNQNYLIGNPSRRATLRGRKRLPILWGQPPPMVFIFHPHSRDSPFHASTAARRNKSKLVLSDRPIFGVMHLEILKKRSSTYQSLRAFTGLERTTKTTSFFLMWSERWSLNESEASLFSLHHTSPSLQLSQPPWGIFNGILLFVIFSIALCVDLEI